MSVTEEQAEERVKRELGPDYSVVKLSGYWVIGHAARASAHSFGRISPEPLRRSLDRAIADARTVTP